MSSPALKLESQSPSARRIRTRYRTDPLFRAEKIRITRAKLAERCQQFPIYSRIVHVRKRIWQMRDDIDRLLSKVRKKERRLLQFTQERDSMVQDWKAQKTQARRKTA
jgi:ribosomal protein S15P/S13E